MERLKDKINNIVVIQTAFLGDVLLTFPLLYYIRKAFPDIILSLVIRKELSEISEIFEQSVNQIILFEKRRNKLHNMFKLIKSLRKMKPELIITPHRSARSAIINYFSKANITIGFSKSSLSSLYDIVIPYDKFAHEIERNLSLVKDFIKYNDLLPEFNLHFPEFDLSKKVSDWINKKEKIIAIAPGSVWETKKYPVEYFSELCSIFIKKNYKLVLIGGRDDLNVSEKIERKVNNDDSLINLTGKLKILESMSLINNCCLLICNDSAPTHMGILTKAKVLTIYGSTIPEFGFYPIRKSDGIIQVTSLKCKPCGIHGRKKCPEKHFRCMRELLPEMVFEKAEEILNLS